MSGRTIWIVRFIGIVIFLVLIYLLASLHSRLVKMSQEGPGRQSAVTGNFELRIAECESHAEKPRRRGKLARSLDLTLRLRVSA